MPSVKKTDHNTGITTTLVDKCVGCSKSPDRVRRDWAYGLTSLFEKTHRSYHLQILEQRYHLFCNYLSLSVGPAGNRTRASRTRLTTWRFNQVVCLDSPKYILFWSDSSIGAGTWLHQIQEYKAKRLGQKREWVTCATLSCVQFLSNTRSLCVSLSAPHLHFLHWVTYVASRFGASYCWRV